MCFLSYLESDVYVGLRSGQEQVEITKLVPDEREVVQEK